MGAKVLVVADADQALAMRVAQGSSACALQLRREIGFDSVSLSIDDALSRH